MDRKISIGLLICANVLWGSSPAVAKVALVELPPPLLGALRFSLAALFIWLVVLWQVRRNNQPGNEAALGSMKRGDMVKLAGLGVFGISLSYLLSYWGISLTLATDASLLIIGDVIFTSFLAFLFIGERPGRWKSLGLLIGIVGVVIVILSNAVGSADHKTGLIRAMGDILVMAGLFCQAVYSVVGMGLTRKYQPLAVLAVTHGGSLLVWLPLLTWYIVSGQFPTMSLAVIGGVVYLAAIISAACFLIWFSVLRFVGANLGAVSLLIQPVVGGVLGIALLGDPLTLGLSVGALLIIMAFYLTAIPDHQSIYSEAINE
jgi:drug/metabolite transporter (DMT)-like permease